MKSKLYYQILEILKRKKYSHDYAGEYEYSDEEKAEMIMKLIESGEEVN